MMGLRGFSLVSPRFHKKDKDLAGINTIWISDLVPVRFVNDGVSHTRAVRDAVDARAKRKLKIP
jgi:hypothetical protein